MGKKKIVQKSAADEKTKGGQSGLRFGGGKKLEKLKGGRIYIKSSYNNTIVSVTDMKGDIIAWASSGSLGFSGPKKATPFASSKIIEAISERLKPTGLTDVEVIVRGVGSGRDSAIRSLINQGFNILSLRDATPVPHNGPRPPKARRV